MTKTHRIKSDPYRPILQPAMPASHGSPAFPGETRPRDGFHFVHDARFHARLAQALQHSWFVAEPVRPCPASYTAS